MSYSNEGKPTYRLIEAQYFSSRKTLKLLFLQSTPFRPVVGYHQVNYVRYPEYGEWSVRTKKISKSLVCTPRLLEELEHNSDPLIAKAAYPIVQAALPEDLYPSWAKVRAINDFYAGQRKGYEEQAQSLEETHQANLQEFAHKKESQEARLAEQKKVEEKLEKRKAQLLQRIATSEKLKRNVVLDFLSIGFRPWFASPSYREVVKERIKKNGMKIWQSRSKITTISATVDALKQSENDEEMERKKDQERFARYLQEVEKKKAKALSEVVPLTSLKANDPISKPSLPEEDTRSEETPEASLAVEVIDPDEEDPH